MMFGDDTFNFGEILRPEQFGLVEGTRDNIVGFSVMDSLNALAEMIRHETLISERMGHIAQIADEAFTPKVAQSKSVVELDENALTVRKMAAGNSLGLGLTPQQDWTEILAKNDDMHETLRKTEVQQHVQQAVNDPITEALARVKRIHEEPYEKTPNDPFYEPAVPSMPEEQVKRASVERQYTSDETSNIEEIRAKLAKLHAGDLSATNDQFALGA